MIRLVALAAGFLALADTPPAPNYDQMKAAAGRDAASQVKLALWCEANGLEAQKLRHLAVAVLSDPSNAMARGLLGLVEYGGKWRRPEAVADALKADVKHADLMADYGGRRVRTPVKTDAQYKLALWCEEKGLKDEARAHLATVVRLDPNHAEAWKRLGYKKVGNRWVTEAQAEREKAERQAQQEADRRWRPRLERLREALDGKGQRKDDAQRELATITDPRAVPAVWHAFVERGGNHQVEAVQLLGQIDAIEASRGLATLAVGSKFVEVRRRATETLRRRDPREWAGMLVVMLQEKIKYEVKRVGGPGSPGELYVEGKKQNVKRIYAPPPMPFVPFLPGDTLATDAYGLPVLVHHQLTPPASSGNTTFTTAAPASSLGSSNAGAAGQVVSKLTHGAVSSPSQLEGLAFAFDPLAQQRQAAYANPEVFNLGGSDWGMVTDVGRGTDTRTAIPVGQMMAEVRRVAATAQEQLENDVAALESQNRHLSEINERIAGVLTAATGESLPAEPKPWRSWFVDQLGFRYKLMTPEDVPTVVEAVPIQAQVRPVAVETSAVGYIAFMRHSCFGKGTPVRTISGSKPIETIEVGDLILAQDTHTGKLGYKPVVMAHHNPPSPTFEVMFGGDAVVTSPSHRFWVAGRGWVMARDLKEGDPIRTLGGVAKVAKIEAGEVQPVFNLDVEGDADFFVGDAAALVHDNTLPDLKQVPFDAPPAIAVK